MRKVWYRNVLLACAVAALFAAVPALAQEQVGGIEGVVVDDGGLPLPGVLVEANGPSGTLSSVTDASGVYRFPRLSPGVYKLKATLQGFATVETEGIGVGLGKYLKVNVTMRPSTFEEAIMVAADQVQIDVTQAQVATAITKEELELLPRGRDFTSVVTQAAGAGDESFLGGISIDGASGSENRFIIDGVDTTHPQDGVSGQGMITDFLEEVQVKTAGYAAEYGGSLGGVINAITKSGGNEFHGSVGVYYTDSSWAGDVRKDDYESNCPPNGDCYIQYKKDDRTQIEPGFSLGGPVMRDKLWFFVAYQPSLISVDRTPLGSSTTYSQDQTDHYLSANLKGNLGSRFLYKFAVNWTPYSVDGALPLRDGTTPADSDFSVKDEYPNESYSLYMDAIPSDSFLISGRLGYFMTDQETSGVDALSHIYFRNGTIPVDESDPRYRPTGYRSAPYASFNATDFDKWERQSAGLDGSWFVNLAGSHQFKFGVQYEKIKNKVSSGENGNYFEVRWGLADRFGLGVKGEYGSVHVRRFRTEGAAEATNYALFLQDSWSVLKNLTVNFGVRAEQERVPNYGAKRDPSLPENAIEFDFSDKLAPRIGFAWDVMSDQKMKVYGSYGTYYDITKLEMPRGSFGADRWIAYVYPLNTLDWATLPGQCTSIADNVLTSNPCPGLGTPVSRDLRLPTDPSTHIDPDLQPMENREWQLGAEYQLTNTSMVGARYVNKSLINTIEDIGYLVTYDDGTSGEEYITGNPGKGLVAGDPDGSGPIPSQPEAVRDYEALELTYDKRFADNWSLRATYTYSKLEGNYSGLASSDEFGRTDPNVARYFDGLAYGFDQNGNMVVGPLNTDRPHAIELYGLYRFNFGTSVGVGTSWRSGTPISQDEQFNGVNYFPYGRKNYGRTPEITQTDLYIAHPFKIGGLDFEVNLNVLNLFDEDAATRIDNAKWQDDLCDFVDDCSYEYYFSHVVPYDFDTIMEANGGTQNPLFGKALDFQAPRAVRLGFKLTF